MPEFYDWCGDVICSDCAIKIPTQELDGPYEIHWFECQECLKQFDRNDSDLDRFHIANA